MQINRTLSENKNLSLALGFFDGVHIAHQKLIKKTVELAQENNLKSAVITFADSPFSILKGINPAYITSKTDKINLIENLGVDYLYILDFNDFKNMNAKEYLNKILIKYFDPKFIITGFNHTFGKNKTGNPSFLKENAKNYSYFELNEIKVENYTVSSTNIKNLIEKGEIQFANKLLGRNFSIEGEVIKGNQIARKLGYKTANLIWPKNIVKPKYGVYKGRAEFNGKKFTALINFGIRPSIDKNLTETLEAHLLNFSQDIYNKPLRVEFISKIRDEIHFNSVDELKIQIQKDYNSIA